MPLNTIAWILSPGLPEAKRFSLFTAGQVNEPPAMRRQRHKVLLGINAVHYILGKPPLFWRSSSYIGTLIDDLTTKGCSDLIDDDLPLGVPPSP